MSNARLFMKAIDKRIDDKNQRDLMSGHVISVTPDKRYCNIRLQGSGRHVRAAVMVGASISPGDTSVCIRLPGTNFWTVLGAYSDSSRISDQALQYSAELAPPNNVALTAGYGALILTWNCPPQKVLTYRIQVADVGDESNPTEYTTSGGVFFYLCDPGTIKTFRLQAVTEDWKKSAWTGWMTESAIGHILYGTLTARPASPVGEFFATDTGELYIGDGSVWYPISGGGGGGGQEILWDPDLPPASPSAYDDEFETQIDAQWTEYDPDALIGVSWVDDHARVVAVPTTADYVAGDWIDLPQQEFTAVVKVTLEPTNDMWNLVAGSRVAFGLVVSEQGSGSEPFVTAEICINRNAQASTTTRQALVTLWSDDNTRTYSEFIYPAGSDIPQNNSEWYLRLRHSPDDTHAYYWRADFSLDGINWYNGVAFRDIGFTTGAKLGIFASNKDTGDGLYVDFEFFRFRTTFDDPQAPCYGQSTAIISHSALNDLDADDHTQYHNDTRGDARYSQLGHTHTVDDITDLKHQALFYFAGTVEVGAHPMPIPNVTGQSKTISKVYVRGTDASGLVVDIHRNGTTIFTNQSHRPTLTGDTGESTNIDVSSWADSDYLTCEIDTAAGSDVVVVVVYS